MRAINPGWLATCDAHRATAVRWAPCNITCKLAGALRNRNYRNPANPAHNCRTKMTIGPQSTAADAADDLARGDRGLAYARGARLDHGAEEFADPRREPSCASARSSTNTRGQVLRADHRRSIEAWRELLFADEDPQPKTRRDPVAAARRNRAAGGPAAVSLSPVAGISLQIHDIEAGADGYSQPVA